MVWHQPSQLISNLLIVTYSIFVINGPNKNNDSVY